MSMTQAASLPWSLAFDRPDDSPPSFQQAVDHALDSVQPDTSGTFAMVPNFRFNHVGYHPEKVEDLYQGTLSVRRDDNGRILATQTDNTSGERWTLSVDGGDRVLTSESKWHVQSAIDNEAIAFDGWIEEADDNRLVFSRLQRCTRLLSKALGDRTLVVRPTLFLGLSAFEGKVLDLIDLTHRYESALKLHRVDTATRSVGGKDVALNCFLLVGANSIPTYWWTDPDDRVVAMSETLWTYVLASPDCLL